MGCRYLVNYSPFDLVFKLFNFLPFKVLPSPPTANIPLTVSIAQLIITVLENVNRARSIHIGIELAVNTLPGSAFGAVLLGTISGIHHVTYT